MGDESVRVSALTRLLLTKYNEPFDETKDICSLENNESKNIKNTMKIYLEDLINLSDNELYQLTQLHRPVKQTNPEHFEYTDTKKKLVQEMSFVEDTELFLKIIMYRKKEILRELASIQKTISVYYNIQIKILNVLAKQHNANKDEPNTFIDYMNQIIDFFMSGFENGRPEIETDASIISRLFNIKQKSEDTLKTDIIENREYILRNTLDKYELLERKVSDLCQTTDIKEFCIE